MALIVVIFSFFFVNLTDMYYLKLNNRNLQIASLDASSEINMLSVYVVKLIVPLCHEINIEVGSRATIVWKEQGSKDYEIQLVVTVACETITMTEVAIKLTLAESLFSATLSGGFYVYNMSRSQLIVNLLNKHDCSIVQQEQKYEDIGSCIVQLPDESDFTILQRLVSQTTDFFTIKNNNILLSINHKKPVKLPVNMIVNKSYTNNAITLRTNEALENIELGDYVNYDNAVYFVAAIDITFNCSNKIVYSYRLGNNCAFPERINNTDVFALAIVVKENVKHHKYEVQIIGGDEITAGVLQDADNNYHHYLNVSYAVGEQVMVFCSVNTSEVWIVGALSSLSMHENLLNELTAEFNAISIDDTTEVITEINNNEQSVNLKTKNTKMSMVYDKTLTTITFSANTLLSREGFSSIEERAVKYDVFSDKYIVSANEITFNVEKLSNLEIGNTSIINSSNMKLQGKAMHAWLDMVDLKYNMMNVQVQEFNVNADKMKVQCNSLILNAETVIVNDGQGAAIVMNDSNIDFSAQYLSLNAKAIILNGKIVPGIAKQHVSKSPVEQSLTDINTSNDIVNLEKTLKVIDEFELLAQEQNTTILEGLKVSIDDKEYVLKNNSISYNTGSLCCNVKI